MRVALYLRISRDEAGEGLGIERQEQDCRQLCERRGWTAHKSYVDNDYSAFSGRVRPSYQRLLEDMAEGKLDAIVSWAPERLHRSPRELEDFLELVERSGIVVETVKAGAWDVSTSHGRLVARMLGAVSRAESERTGERVSRAHQQAKAAGYWRGPIPFGMKASSAPGMPEEDPATGHVVRYMLDRLQRGDSLTSIASALNAAGHRPRRAASWTHTGVLYLIQSPALGGMVKVDGELHEALFTGLVTPSQWRDAQAQIRARPRHEKFTAAPRLTLLGSMLFCGEHGSTLYGAMKPHGPVYSAGGSRLCAVSIKRPPTDDFVTRIVIERLSRPDAAALLKVDPQSSALQEEAHKLRQRRDEITQLLGEGLLSGALARPQLEAISVQLSTLEEPEAPSVINAGTLRDPAAAWGSWSLPQRRAALRILFARLTVRHGHGEGPRADPTRVSITWA